MIGKYKFHNSSHYGARSPADLDRDPEEYAALVVKNIQAHQLADVPDDVLTPDEARSAYVDSLGGSHKWISNPADDGWLLIDAAKNPVELANGDHVEFKFDEIPVLVGTSRYGRSLVKNPDGTESSERTATVTDQRINNGRPTNIPTMFNGIQVDQERAIEMISAADGVDPETGEALPAHESIPTAVQAAKSRSDKLGRENRLDPIRNNSQGRGLDGLTGRN